MTETIDWCPYLPKHTTSAKLDEVLSRAPCVVLVPDEISVRVVEGLLAVWLAGGDTRARDVDVRLGGTWA